MWSRKTLDTSSAIEKEDSHDKILWQDYPQAIINGEASEYIVNFDD